MNFRSKLDKDLNIKKFALEDSEAADVNDSSDLACSSHEDNLDSKEINAEVTAQQLLESQQEWHQLKASKVKMAENGLINGNATHQFTRDLRKNKTLGAHEADVNYSYCHQVEDIKIDNERYKNKLRTEQGLYFDFNVQSSPGRKQECQRQSQTKPVGLHSDQLFRYRSPQAKRQTLYKHTLITKQQQQKQIPRSLSNERLVQTENCKVVINPASEIKSKKHQSRQLQQSQKDNVNFTPRKSNSQISGDHKNKDEDLDKLNDRGEQKNEQIGQNIGFKQSQTLTQYQHCNEIKLFQPIGRSSSQTFSQQQLHTVQSFRQANDEDEIKESLLSRDIDSIKSLSNQDQDNQMSADDDYQNLRDFEDYLFENYTSPTVLDLCKQKRLNEIKKIDENCENLKQLLRLQKQNYQKQNTALENICESQANLSANESKQNDSIIFSENNSRLLLRQNTLKKEQFKKYSTSQVNQIVKKISKQNLQKIFALSPQTQNKKNGPSSFKLAELKTLKVINSAKSSARYQQSSNQSDSKIYCKDFQGISNENSPKKIDDIQIQDRLQNIEQIESKQFQKQNNQQQIQTEPVQLDTLNIRKKVSFVEKKVDSQKENTSQESSKQQQTNDLGIMEVDNEQDFEDLMGINISLIEPNSALLKSSPKQKQAQKYQNGRRQTQIIRPVNTLQKNRKLSNLSGQSQTGSDEEDDFQSSSQDCSSSASSDLYGSNRFKNSKFQSFQIMQNLRKSIFTRKIHDKTCLALKKQVKIHQNELPHLVKSVSQVDFSQMIEICNSNNLIENQQKISRQDQIQKLRDIDTQPLQRLMKSLQFQQSNGTESNEDQDQTDDVGSHELIQSLTINKTEYQKLPKLNNYKSQQIKSMQVKLDSSQNIIQKKQQVTKKKTNYTINKSKKTKDTKNNSKRNSSKYHSHQKKNENSEQATSKKNRISKITEVDSRIQKKERKRNIKRLLQSSAKQESDDFIENQQNQLDWLQKLSEILKGKDNLRPSYEKVYDDGPKKQEQIIEEDEYSRNYSENKDSISDNQPTKSPVRCTQINQTGIQSKSNTDANDGLSRDKSSSKDSLESVDDIYRLTQQAKMMKLVKSKSHDKNNEFKREPVLSEIVKQEKINTSNSQLPRGQPTIKRGLIKLQSKSLKQLAQSDQFSQEDLIGQTNNHQIQRQQHVNMQMNNAKIDDNAEFQTNILIQGAPSQSKTGLNNKLDKKKINVGLDLAFSQNQGLQAIKSFQGNQSILSNQGNVNSYYQNAFDGNIQIKKPTQLIHLPNTASNIYNTDSRILNSIQNSQDKNNTTGKTDILNIFQCKSVPLSQKKQLCAGYDSTFTKDFRKSLREITKQLEDKVRQNTISPHRISSHANNNNITFQDNAIINESDINNDYREQKLDLIKNLLVEEDNKLNHNKLCQIKSQSNTKLQRQLNSEHQQQKTQHSQTLPSNQLIQQSNQFYHNLNSTFEPKMQKQTQNNYINLQAYQEKQQYSNTSLGGKPKVTLQIRNTKFSFKKQTRSLDRLNQEITEQNQTQYESNNFNQHQQFREKKYYNNNDNNISIEEESILTPEDRVMVSGPSSINHSPISSLKISPDGQKLFQFFISPSPPPPVNNNETKNLHGQINKNVKLNCSQQLFESKQIAKNNLESIDKKVQMKQDDSLLRKHQAKSTSNLSILNAKSECKDLKQQFQAIIGSSSSNDNQIVQKHSNPYPENIQKLKHYQKYDAVCRLETQTIATKSQMSQHNKLENIGQLSQKQIQKNAQSSRNYKQHLQMTHLISQRSQLSKLQPWKKVRTQLDKQRKHERQRVEQHLKLEKQVTNNIRHHIDRDLDDLQIIFSKKKHNHVPLMANTQATVNNQNPSIQSNIDKKLSTNQGYKIKIAQIDKQHKFEQIA